jgi:transposase-like protein
MAARLTLPRTAAWVWHGEPRSIFGLDAVFVRCASGTSGIARSGFGYADNFRAWLRARGPAVIPWSWFGPPHSTDGLASADALAAIAPGQRVYVVEVGSETPPAQVAAFAARLRQREPIAALGFSTWPTRAEAEQAAVPWDACVDAFDFGLPQVCTPAQRQLLLRDDSPVVEDMAGKPIHVAVFPDADPLWVDSARLGVAEHAGASAFSVDQSSFSAWRRQLGALGEGRQELPPPAAAPPPEPAPEPRPEAQETLTPVHFDEPGELALLANRILAVVQARLDNGGRLTDDEMVTEIEDVLRDTGPGGGRA